MLRNRKKTGHPKLDVLKKIGDATLGGLVGFNLGLTSEPLMAVFFCTQYVYRASRFEEKPAVVDVAVLGVASPVMFTVSPFYGAVRGAQIGALAGFKHSLLDVPGMLAYFPVLEKIYDPYDTHFKLFDIKDYVKIYKDREKTHWDAKNKDVIQHDSTRFFSNKAKNQEALSQGKAELLTNKRSKRT